MAFTLKNLTTLDGGVPKPTAGTGSIPIFQYATNDTKANLVAANYWDAAAAWLPVGSFILASLDLDGTPGAAALVVTANTGSAVTVGYVAVA